MTMTPAQRQALVFLATTVRAYGAPERDADQITAHVNHLAAQGISAREVIDQTLALAWGQDPIPSHPVEKPAARAETPSYDETSGKRLRHTPLRELFEDRKAELDPAAAPTTPPTNKAAVSVAAPTGSEDAS